jgi:hypothetical protein
MNALLSLTSIEALAVLTSVHHLDELGIMFLGPALIVVYLWYRFLVPSLSMAKPEGKQS